MGNYEDPEIYSQSDPVEGSKFDGIVRNQLKSSFVSRIGRITLETGRILGKPRVFLPLLVVAGGALAAGQLTEPKADRTPITAEITPTPEEVPTTPAELEANIRNNLPLTVLNGRITEDRTGGRQRIIDRPIIDEVVDADGETTTLYFTASYDINGNPEVTPVTLEETMTIEGYDSQVPTFTGRFVEGSSTGLANAGLFVLDGPGNLSSDTGDLPVVASDLLVVAPEAPEFVPAPASPVREGVAVVKPTKP